MSSTDNSGVGINQALEFQSRGGKYQHYQEYFLLLNNFNDFNNCMLSVNAPPHYCYVHFLFLRLRLPNFPDLRIRYE